LAIIAILKLRSLKVMRQFQTASILLSVGLAFCALSTLPVQAFMVSTTLGISFTEIAGTLDNPGPEDLDLAEALSQGSFQNLFVAAGYDSVTGQGSAIFPFISFGVDYSTPLTIQPSQSILTADGFYSLFTATDTSGTTNFTFVATLEPGTGDPAYTSCTNACGTFTLSGFGTFATPFGTQTLNITEGKGTIDFFTQVPEPFVSPGLSVLMVLGIKSKLMSQKTDHKAR
jgi:hypothetical protein